MFQGQNIRCNENSNDFRDVNVFQNEKVMNSYFFNANIQKDKTKTNNNNNQSAKTLYNNNDVINF